MIIDMLNTDLLRSHQERLLLSIQPALSSHTGMLHTATSWHPHEKAELTPLAENFALVLIWCRTKNTESILQARALLSRLLKWRRELFPKYLHELDQSVCEHSSRRIRLVLYALLKWHVLAVGDLNEPIRDCLLDIERRLNLPHHLSSEGGGVELMRELLVADPQTDVPQVDLGDGESPTTESLTCQSLGYEPHALYYSPDLFDLFQFHIMDQALPSSLKSRVVLATAPWGEPCWLEKPLPALFKSDSLLEVFQYLQMGKLPACTGLAQIWSCLIHENGQLLPTKSRESSDSYGTYRSLESVAQKRYLASSCTLHLKNEQGGQLLLLCERASVSVDKMGRHYDVSICDQNGRDETPQGNGQAHGIARERQPLFMIATEQVKGWALRKSSGDLAMGNFFSSQELLAGGSLHHTQHAWKIELIESNQPGSFHQHPWRGVQESIEEPFKRRLLVYTPIHSGRSATIRLRITIG